MSSKNQNPREGLETTIVATEFSLDDLIEFLQKTKIPARGLKLFVRNPSDNDLTVSSASKNQNPREGIETRMYIGMYSHKSGTSSKNQNPREGIETELHRRVV